ncbi:MAG: lipid A deacylase LpxR family protein, partial [Alphaproteobacteria bacterium]
LFAVGGDVRFTVSAGQNMYTPADISLRHPPATDRPYAGWTYGSIGIVSETGRRLDQLELALGIVGPQSYAEHTQAFVHDLIGSQEPNGWDTQLRNEPGLVLTYQRSARAYFAESAGHLGFDVTPHAGAALGNVFTYASGGLTLRVGEDLPLDYGPPRIQPSLPGSGFFRPAPGATWYVFAGVEGRAVARNIFLDGNSFRSGPHVDRHPLVGDFQFGFVLTWNAVRFSYTNVIRTPEFKNQTERDDFGAVSISVQF